ncbi:MAG: hypothetical protein WCO60_17650 [Verrucomicrobiota bacterium]
MSKAKKNQRECPVLKKPISSADCGSGRGSLYACPAECPHYPFTPANYTRHGEIEAALVQKTHARAEQVLAGEEQKQWRAVFYSSQKSAIQGIRTHAELVQLYHLQRDADGLSFTDRWLADPGAGLNNDERVLLRAMGRLRPVLLEVHRFLDGQTTEGVDHLTGETVRVIDRSLAANIDRYSTLLTWQYSMSHYERLSGTVEEVPECGPKSSLEVVRELICHLGGPSDSAGQQDWLTWNFSKISEAILAVSEARWQKSLAKADYRFTKTDYVCPDQRRVETLLKKNENCEEDELQGADLASGFDMAFVVLERAHGKDPAQLQLSLPGQGGTAGFGQGPTLLGRVLLGKNRLRIETNGDKRRQAVRTLVERIAGGQIQFKGELTDDYGARLAGKAPGFDASLVPASLLEDSEPFEISTQLVADEPGGAPPSPEILFRKRYEFFLDESVPALQGLTPREAAARPEKRPLLVALMKTHIRGCDQKRREEGLDLDLNPLLSELGLLELISDPRPLDPLLIHKREKKGRPEENELDHVVRGVFGEEPEDDFESLTEEEMEERLETMRRRYPTAADAAEGVKKAFPGLLEKMPKALEALIKPGDWLFLKPLMVRACHIFIPKQGRPPRLRMEGLMDRVHDELANLSEVMAESSGVEEAVDLWIQGSMAPVVMDELVGALFELVESVGKKDRPSAESALVILACIGALVEELAFAD